MDNTIKIQVDETGLMGRPVNPYPEINKYYSDERGYEYGQFEICNPPLPLATKVEANSIMDAELVYQYNDPEIDGDGFINCDLKLFETLRRPNFVETRIAYAPIIPIKGKGEKASDGWISVECEIKPENEQWVQVASKITNGLFDVHLRHCQYSKKYDIYTGHGEAQHDGRITHWKPLPNPPLT